MVRISAVCCAATHVILAVLMLINFSYVDTLQSWAMRTYGNQTVTSERVFRYLSLYIKKVCIWIE